MRVLVCGSRTYSDKLRVFETLDQEHDKNPIDLLIHGACHLGGADILAEGWAKSREITYIGVPARFKHGPAGKSAGPLRNKQMLIDWTPGLVIAFGGLGADPNRGGTNHMVRITRAAGIRLIEVDR